MGRRILAFFLGVIFGIILVLGAVAGAIYIVVAVKKVDELVPDSSKYLGDLANMSAYDLAMEVYNLYLEKLGVQEDGKYFTIEQFASKYNINLNEAFGIDFPQEVLDIPVFEFINGQEGLNNAMKQIKISAIPSIVNMFGNSEEGTFSADLVAELSNFYLYDLLDENVGITTVFQNIRFSDVLDVFPSIEGDNKLMWAVGQTSIGKLLKGITGESNILLQLREEGAFEELGKLPVLDILGESTYVKAILGDTKVADLIDENGSLNFDAIVNGISIGEMLGCQKQEMDVQYYETITLQNGDTIIRERKIGDSILYVKTTDSGESWYEAEANCNAEENHIHSLECFDFVWYSVDACTNTGHDHGLAGDMFKDGVTYPRVSGLYGVLANLSIADLTSGDGNALFEKIKQIQIGDLLDGMGQTSELIKNISHMTIGEMISGGFETLYLGTVFGFERNPAAQPEGNVAEYVSDNLKYYVAKADGEIFLSGDGKEWYDGKLNCNDDSCAHISADCYGYIWYIDGTHVDRVTGAQAVVSNYTIGSIKSINAIINKLTLDEVLGDKVPSMLDGIRYEPIGNLQNAINSLYLGGFLDYTRRSVDITAESENVTALITNDKTVGYVTTADGQTYLSEDGKAWYEAKIICTDESHNETSHRRDCYSYLWYKDKGLTTTAEGVMGKLADKKVNELGSLNETVQTLTIRDVLDEDSIPTMLKSIADTPINGLNDAINNMYIGELLEYTRTLDCNESHEHGNSCYVWKDASGNPVNGMFAKLSNKKVSELNSMDDTIKTFTLKDVLGEVPPMLKEFEDTEIGNLSNVLDNIYIGSAMSYLRKPITNTDGYSLLTEGASGSDSTFTVIKNGELYAKRENNGDWYEAVLDCNDSAHTSGNHTVDCYAFVWYVNDEYTTKPRGITAAFVNYKITSTGISDATKDLTIRKLGIDYGDNKLLEAIQDVKLDELGTAINDIKLGVALGYTRGDKLSEAPSCNKGHAHNDNCYDYYWYEDSNKNVEVKGLNGKLSNLTVGGMAGGNAVSDIAQSLTIGDLIDSGMVDLEEDDQYKLNILFCDDDGSFTGTTTITVSGTPMSITKTYKCTMPDYLTYTAQPDADKSAKNYYNKFTHNGNCEESWKTMPLKEFISDLLTALS